jgi:hypothetical protein
MLSCHHAAVQRSGGLATITVELMDGGGTLVRLCRIVRSGLAPARRSASVSPTHLRLDSPNDLVILLAY